MGVEVKGVGDYNAIADRGCNDGCGCRDHSGWGSGWGAVGDNHARNSFTKDCSGVGIR